MCALFALTKCTNAGKSAKLRAGISSTSDAYRVGSLKDLLALSADQIVYRRHTARFLQICDLLWLGFSYQSADICVVH